MRTSAGGAWGFLSFYPQHRQLGVVVRHEPAGRRTRRGRYINREDQGDETN